jgi:hypothetical protein
VCNYIIMHTAWKRILPYCKVAKTFGLLPFTGYDEAEGKLKTSKAVQAVSLFILLTAYSIYLMHIFRNMNTLIISYQDSAAASLVITLATHCAAQTADALNVLEIIRLSRGNLKMTNQLLKTIERADQLLRFNNASPILLSAVASFCYTWTKIAVFLYIFDSNDLAYYAGIRFISAVIITTENFYCLLCNEISARFCLINAELHMLRKGEKVLNILSLRRLVECFETMLRATHLLRTSLRYAHYRTIFKILI